MGAAVDAIRQGDAAKLSNHFSQKLEVSVPPNADGEYSKNQALFIFKEYFMNYPVKSFKLLHKGSSGKSYYAMGQYVSAKGRFDTNIFIKKSNGQYVIDEIRFEQAN